MHLPSAPLGGKVPDVRMQQVVHNQLVTQVSFSRKFVEILRYTRIVVSLSFCRNPQGIPNLHPIWHRMTAIEESTAFVDGDYVGFKLQQGKYNYLDPNFIPKSR